MDPTEHKNPDYNFDDFDPAPPTQPAVAGDDDEPPLPGPPVPPVHPNVLVAVTSARIRLTEMKTVRTDPYISTINTGNPEISRFAHMLDALASLALDKDGLTIAIALHQTEGILKFTVAENKGASKEVLDHLTWLVDQLKSYGGAQGPKRDDIGFEIMKRSYLFSRQKMWSRLNRRKWLFDLEKQLLPDGKLLWPPKYINLISSFIRMQETLNCVREWTALPQNQVKGNSIDGRSKKEPVTEQEWKDLFLAMDGSMDGLSSVQENKSFGRKDCSDYAGAALKVGVSKASGKKEPLNPDEQNTPVPLYRTIEKLTSHHRFLHQLFLYAASPEGREDLKGLNTVVGMGAMGTVDVTFPSIEETTEIMIPLLPPNIKPKRLGPIIDRETAKIVRGAREEFQFELQAKTGTPFKGQIHCECALIAEFNKENHPKMWPINYIGVSKLSCAPCYLWIQAFNASHAEQHHTRGTHGKWYPKWGMPDVPMSTAMTAAMTRLVKEAYTNHVSSPTRARRIELSDSTEAKGSLTDLPFTSTQVQRRVTLLEANRRVRAANGNSVPLPVIIQHPPKDGGKGKFEPKIKQESKE